MQQTTVGLLLYACHGSTCISPVNPGLPDVRLKCRHIICCKLQWYWADCIVALYSNQDQLFEQRTILTSASVAHMLVASCQIQADMFEVVATAATIEFLFLAKCFVQVIAGMPL